jgi:hypothetical protein
MDKLEKLKFKNAAETEEECLDRLERQEVRLADSKHLEIKINQLIEEGLPVTVIPADDSAEGSVGYSIFSSETGGEDLLTFYHAIRFRPEVKTSVRCESKAEYDRYKEEALLHKWLVSESDEPRNLTVGFTVQNSDGVTRYTIRLQTYLRGA